MPARWSTVLMIAFVLVSIVSWESGQRTIPGAEAGSLSHRRIIIIQGIDSFAGHVPDDGLDVEGNVVDTVCDTYGVDNNDGTSYVEFRDNLFGALDSVRDRIVLDHDTDILGLSYSGEYCDEVPNQFTMPKYDQPDTCAGIESAAAELQRIMDAYPLDTFDIVGHSMGGMTAVYWASEKLESDPDFVRSRVHSIWTIDSPLEGEFSAHPFDSACAKTLQPICSGGSPAWRQITHCDPAVVDSITRTDSDGISVVAKEVPLGHLVTSFIGATLPGFWRENTPCGSHSDLGGSHGCALEQASRLRPITDGIATEVIDDRDLAVGSGWATSANSFFVGGSALNSSTDGAAISFEFVGTDIALVYRRLSIDGYLADVSVDGDTRETKGLSTCSRFGWDHFDTFGSDPLCVMRFQNLARGTHTLSIRVKDCFSCSNPIAIDAFEVLDKMVPSTKVDVAFVIDTTGSMVPYIDAVKSAANSIVNSLSNSGNDVRIGVVLYRDAGDIYVNQAALMFTSDADAAVTAIDGISVGGGGDTPEAVYCALRSTIDGSAGAWRETPNKFIILMGDAPSHNPDFACSPSQTASSVITAAINADPITIEAIPLTGSISDFSTVAQGTGGQVFPATTPAAVVTAILETIETILSTPSADAGGPYAGFVGSAVTFDGSGSTDSDGTISQYEWDFDNDGAFDATSASPSAIHTYSSPYSGQVRLRVTDNDGLAAVDTADINVVEPPTPTDTPTATATPSPTVTPTPVRTVAPTRTVVRTPTQLPVKCADVNGDHRVTLADLFLVLGHVGRPYKARYDLNNDRRVDLRDVFIVWHQLGRRC